MPAAAQMLPTFFESLTQNRFSLKDQGRINTAVTRFINNPEHPSLSLERLRKTRDKNFWSGRVTDGIRIIIYKKKEKSTLCYVGSHDDAYRWAENKKVLIETGSAIQIIDVEYSLQPEPSPVHDASEYENIPSNERQEIKPAEKPENFVFREYSDSQLLSFGAPGFCLTDIRKIGTEDDLLESAVNKWGMSDEIFFNLAAAFDGNKPSVLHTAPGNPEPIIEPPSVVGKIYPTVELEDNQALRSAMDKPWDQWLVFLDPTQKDLIRRNYSGPAKIYGSAGTGKTVVALHRAAFLARQENITAGRIFLLTFSKTLANDLTEKLGMLVEKDTPESSRISVSDFETFALKKYFEFNPGSNLRIAEDLLTKRAAELAVKDLNLDSDFSRDFVHREYLTFIGPWGIQTLDDYLGFQRQGSGRQLGPERRKRLWPAFQYMRNYVEENNRITKFDLFRSVREQLEAGGIKIADHIVIDECQDIGPEILRMIRAMVPRKDNDIFLCGDLGQSLYRRHHSWRDHGIDIIGRSRVLRINYRTSRQIKEAADHLTELQTAGEDGIVEDRRAVSKFDGPKPVVKLYKDEEAESGGLAQWLKDRIDEGIEAHELCIISRTANFYRRAQKAADLANLRIWQLDAKNNWHNGLLGFSSTERSKGLEFKGVAVIACDANVMPLARRVESASDTKEENEILDLEKNQLYVAMTRARDCLYISGTEPGSRFLTELPDGGVTS